MSKQKFLSKRLLDYRHSFPAVRSTVRNQTQYSGYPRMMHDTQSATFMRK